MVTPRDTYARGDLLRLVAQFPSLNECAKSFGWTRSTLQRYVQLAKMEEQYSDETKALQKFVEEQTTKPDCAWTFDLDLSDEGYAEVVLLSDMHIGSMYSRLDRIKESIEEIAAKPHALCLIMGDTLEVNSKNAPGWDKPLLSVDESIDLTVEILKPIQDQLAILLPGNHEQRAARALNSDFDPTKIIAYKLDAIPGLNPEFLVCNVEDQQYTGLIHHGTGRSGRRSVGVLHVENLSHEHEADFVAMGHLHHHMAWERIVKKVGKEGIIEYKTILCALCGAFYSNKKGGFRAEWGLPPTVLKPMWIQLYPGERKMTATV